MCLRQKLKSHPRLRCLVAAGDCRLESHSTQGLRRESRTSLKMCDDQGRGTIFPLGYNNNSNEARWIWWKGYRRRPELESGLFTFQRRESDQVTRPLSTSMSSSTEWGFGEDEMKWSLWKFYTNISSDTVISRKALQTTVYCSFPETQANTWSTERSLMVFTQRSYSKA